MARLIRFAVGVTTLMGCGLAMAEPISIIVALAPIIGGTAAAFAATAAGFLATYGLAIATIGFGLLSSNQAKRKQAAAAAAQRSQYNASLQDRNVTGLSAEASWQVVYGQPAPVGGSIVAILSSGSKDQFKHLVVVFAAHPSSAINEIYIDGEAVGALSASGDCTVGAFYESSNYKSATEAVVFSSMVGALSRVAQSIVSAVDITGESHNVSIRSGQLVYWQNSPEGFTLYVTYTYADNNARVNIQKHLSPGGVDVGDAFLESRVGYLKWSGADRLSGYTYAVITLDQNLARFQGGPPNITVQMFGKLVYDPRTATTVYSRNPALCLADFIMSEVGYGASLAQFDLPALIAAANACDAQGFYCDGAFKTEQDRESTKQQLEDSFGGTCHQSGGVWRISAGAWSTPVMTLTDADLAAPIQITQASYTSKERFNTVRGKFVDGAGLGVSTDFTPWQNAAYVATDGLVKVRDITLPFTNDHQRAQNLARMLAERSRGGLIITYPGQMRLWPLQPGDRVSITNAEFGWLAKTFRVIDWSFHPRSPVALTMVEDVAIYYNSAAVIFVDLSPNTNLPNPYNTQALSNLSATSGTNQLLKQSDGTIVARVLWQWQATTDNYITTGGSVQRMWRLATATDDVWNMLPDEPGSSMRAYQTDAPDGVGLVLAARFVNELGIPGPWSFLFHQVIGKTEPPGDVAVFTLDDGVLNWSAVVAVDLAGYAVRFNYGVNDWWDGAQELYAGLTTSTSQPLLKPLLGTVTLLIKAQDTSGNQSVNAAAIVTNQGSAVINNLFVSYPQAPLFADGAITGGAVSAGVLYATATDFFYGPDDEPFYGADIDDFYAASTYVQMQYQFSVTPTAAGLLYMDTTIVASNALIEFQRYSQDAFYGAPNDLFYSADADPFYGLPTQWATWGGALQITTPEQITFRVTTVAGPTQGQISQLTPKLDVPDVVESFNNVTVSASGSRLALTKTYRVIENVQLTVQADGNGGITARIEDKDASLGPLIRVFNSAGTAVAGLIDVDLQGY